MNFFLFLWTKLELCIYYLMNERGLIWKKKEKTTLHRLCALYATWGDCVILFQFSLSATHGYKKGTLSVKRKRKKKRSSACLRRKKEKKWAGFLLFFVSCGAPRDSCSVLSIDVAERDATASSCLSLLLLFCYCPFWPQFGEHFLWSTRAHWIIIFFFLITTEFWILFYETNWLVFSFLSSFCKSFFTV